jgi:hypothetical protein
MTGNGKIARLPNSIRAQLNQRLLDGQQGKMLVQWLNSLPEVQAVMQEAFEGRPISEENVSQWKNGGFLIWAAGERSWETVCAFMDGTSALKSAAKGGLTDSMALMMAAIMAGQMHNLDGIPESSEKAKIWRELRISLLALRRSELYAQRLKIENRIHPALKRTRQPKRMTPEERVQRTKKMSGIQEGYDGTKNPELTRRPASDNRAKSELIGANRSKSGH